MKYRGRFPHVWPYCMLSLGEVLLAGMREFQVGQVREAYSSGPSSSHPATMWGGTYCGDDHEILMDLGTSCSLLVPCLCCLTVSNRDHHSSALWGRPTVISTWQCGAQCPGRSSLRLQEANERNITDFIKSLQALLVPKASRPFWDPFWTSTSGAKHRIFGHPAAPGHRGSDIEVIDTSDGWALLSGLEAQISIGGGSWQTHV